MRRFEYMLLDVSESNYCKVLNEYGRGGWNAWHIEPYIVGFSTEKNYIIHLRKEVDADL